MLGRTVLTAVKLPQEPEYSRLKVLRADDRTAHVL